MQYRVTSVSRMDGKATTMVFKSKDAAFDLYNQLRRDVGQHMFITIGSRAKSNYGDDNFTPIAAYVSAGVAALPTAVKA